MAVCFKKQVPFLVGLFASGSNLLPVVVDVGWSLEGLGRVEAKLLLQLDNVVWLQWGTVDGGGTCVQGAETDGGGHLDAGWLVGGGLGGLDGSGQRLVVCVCVRHVDDLPAVRRQSLGHVFGEGQVGGTVDGDTVVVVEGNQVTQLQVAGERARLGGDTLHHTPITEEGVGVAVGDLVVWLVVLGAEVFLRNGQSDGVGDTLAQRTRGDVDARRLGLRVARCLGVQLSELLQVVDGDWVAQEVEHHVQERNGVTVRQHETVSVDPFRVLWVGLQLRKQNVCCRSHAHRGARVARVGLGDGVDCKHSDGVDCLGGEVGHGGGCVCVCVLKECVF